MKKLDISLIGNGVSSYYFLLLLNNYTKNFSVNIKWIYSDNLFPRVAPEIWPIITLNGIEKGVNSLGDLLFDSYHHFKNINNAISFATRVNQYMLCDKKNSVDKKKFIRRHRKMEPVKFYDQNLNGVALASFFVKPIDFFEWVESELRKNANLKIERINSVVTNVSEQSEKFIIDLNVGQKIESKVLFIFSGVGSKFLPVNFYEGSKTHRNQISSGRIYTLNHETIFGDPFILTHDKKNIIYDGNGIVQTNICPDEPKSFISSIFENQFGPLYGENDFKEFSGLRDKGRKRLPQRYFYKKDDLFLFKLSGLYKNAWTISIKEVDEVLREWLN